MTSIHDLIGKLSPDIHRRGRQFERICKWFLENDPEYKLQIKRVWLWDDWPERWGRDKGIDLIAETLDGKFWAIQSKAYALKHSVTKQDFDKFLSESSRKIISYRLMISTAAEFGHNAKEVIAGQEKPVGTLFFSDLKNRKLNWPSSPDDLSAKQEPPHKPRPDQDRAIADVVRGFKSEPRGQLIRACGTGKTLIGLRVAEAMKSQRTLVLVPSISLVSQILGDWAKDGLLPFRFLPVCSDETIGGEDELDVELGVPSTTDPAKIAEFMRGSGRRVVFSTYKSSPKIALAFKRHKLKPFDLVIADEAHRCAGVNDGDAATILDPQAIRARKRLFMTATPRIASEATKSRADSMGLELVSMEDNEHGVFGRVFHELKFSEAIRLKLLTDYRVEIIGVDDPTYRQYAEEGMFVTLDGKIVTDARKLTSHIAVAKAMKKYDLRRVITFHGRISRAKEFADQFRQFIRWMPQADIPSGEIWTELISGDMASNKRNAILDRLREVQPPARGIVTNSRCLSEGIDVRALDGVAFIDPKESQVDIIQAVGRAIRKAGDEKKHGVIILPVYISSDEDEEKTLEDSSFKQVWRVLRALRAHDDQLACELDNLRTNLGQRGKVRAHLPTKITINLPTRLNAKFADAFYLRTVRAITPPPPLTIEQILKWADAHHRKTGIWPKVASGDVLGAPAEKWLYIHAALYRGDRGLPGGSSLAQLLAEKRGVRNHLDLPDLTIKQILRWADEYYQKTHTWPKATSGDVLNVPSEKWGNIQNALVIGLRSLTGGSSLAQLLAEKRGVRNRLALSDLSIKQILKWADAHHQKTSHWPTNKSGEVQSASEDQL
jgi:predicted helicase